MPTRFTFVVVLVMLFGVGLLLEPSAADAARKRARKGKQAAGALKISEETQECLGCHEDLMPGLVADWRTSLHARTSPLMALKKDKKARRMSAPSVPKHLQEVAVGCYECHGQRADTHKDSFDHNGYNIHIVVTPPDCGTCHPAEVSEYKDSKKAHAVGILDNNPVYHTLVNTVLGVKGVKDGKLERGLATAGDRAEACFACHGTTVKFKGMKTIQADGDEMEVPDLEGWPNHGVGRVNPDGSRGSCSACHARHAFSIAVARNPRTCAQCHLAPDVPAWEVWRESKHGNIALSDTQGWDWNAVPWKVGKDFRSPTCAVCHVSAVSTPAGEMLAPRTHDFGARLWVRIFGLPYAHPQPKTGDTSIIRNKDGLPLPTTFLGEPASAHLIDKAEQDRRKQGMSRVCRACHSTQFTKGHFDKLDATIASTNRMTRLATDLVMEAWKTGLADNGNPFDEPIEIKWTLQWLFYANSIRYGSAMGGPDYAGFKNGWWKLNANLAEMVEKVADHKKKVASKPK